MAEYPDRLKDLEYSFSIDPTQSETWDHTAYREDANPIAFPKDLLMYLPEPAQRQVMAMDFVLPFNEAMGLIKEAQVQRYSMARKLNDPQGRGFHGGDPERVGKESLTNSPIEKRGRRYASAGQKYESSPNVYRTALPESTLLTNKYMRTVFSPLKGDLAEPAGDINRLNMEAFSHLMQQDKESLKKQSENFGDFPRYGIEAGAYYSPYDDLTVLNRNPNPKQAAHTKAHESIHRGFGSVGPVDSNRHGPVPLQNVSTETAHDYMRALFDEENPEGVADYDYLIEALKNNLLARE